VRYDDLSGTREWYRPLRMRPGASNIELAIILDMIADCLSLELNDFRAANQDVDCTGLEYVLEQVERYSRWARGDFGD